MKWISLDGNRRINVFSTKALFSVENVELQEWILNVT